MKQTQAHQDLASIRNLMERSSKFLSLSGLSGVLAGVYALIGAGVAYHLIYDNPLLRRPHLVSAPATHGTDTSATTGLFYGDGIPYESGHRFISFADTDLLIKLVAIALAVLGASLLTGFILSLRKARRTGQKFWNASGKALAFNLAVPLITGGAMMLIFLLRGYFGIIAPASLIFYGLALIGAGNYTYKGVQYLGINEIILGLIAALFPGYGLLFWAIGFGVLHIIYGAVMHFKYEK